MNDEYEAVEQKDRRNFALIVRLLGSNLSARRAALVSRIRAKFDRPLPANADSHELAQYLSHELEAEKELTIALDHQMERETVA